MVAILAAAALNVASAVDGLMKPYAGDVPGAAVVVVHDGAVALRLRYGLADVEKHVAVTPKTNFRLASVTKQFTAASVEILAERGKLSYDDPIGRFLPSLPPYARAVTIRQLLTHTGGLPDYEDLIPQTATKQVSDADVLRLIEQTGHPYFAPGSSYRYSNTGYVWHSGETVSFRNVIVRFPDDRLTVVVLTNRDDPEPYKTALAIADLFL